MRASPAQTSFVGGEISRNAHAIASTGNEGKQNSVALAKNMQVLSEGPAVGRQGSGLRGIAGAYNAFLGPPTVVYGDGPFDSRTFTMSDGNEYTLVFFQADPFNILASVYKNKVPIPDPANPAAPFYIAVQRIPASVFGQFTVIQNFDALYFFNKAFDPFKITRYSDTLWEIEDLVFKDGPYLGLGIPSTNAVILHEYKVASLTIAGVATAGSIVTLTSKAGDYAAYAIATMVDRGDGVIRFTVAGDNDFRTGSLVFISGALGTTNANGSFRVTKVSPTTYDIEDPYGVIVSPTFNGAYGGSGQIAPGAFGTFEFGKLVRVKTSSANPWGIIRIIAVTDAANAQGVVLRTLTTVGTTFLFRFSAFSSASYIGYNPEPPRPHVAAFHKGRLWIGGSGDSENIIFGSNLEDFENFAPTDYDAAGTVLDTNAVSASINSDKRAEIKGMSSVEFGLIVGTTDGSFVFRASSANEAITPRNAGFDFLDTKFCSNFGFATVGKTVIFITSDLSGIAEFSNFYNEDGFRTTELTQFARHFLANAANGRIFLQQGTEQTAYFVNGLRQIVGITYKREGNQLIAGFFAYKLGGQYSDELGVNELKDTSPQILCVSAGENGLYIVAKRTINGASVNTLEYIEKSLTELRHPEQFLGVDCATTQSTERGATAVTRGLITTFTDPAHGMATGDFIKIKSAPGMFSPIGVTFPKAPFEVTVVDVNTFTIDFDSSLFTALSSGLQLIYYQAKNKITGLSMYEGEELEVQADGFSLGLFEVVGGEIDLDDYYGVINAGFPFTSELNTLSFDVGAGDGATRGKQRRSEQVAIEVVRSTNFEISANGKDFQEVDLSVADKAQDRQIFDRLFTGIRDRIGLEGDTDVENGIIIRQTKAEPLMVLGIYPQVVAYDRG